MDPGPYLQRIGFAGEAARDLATLEALQRAHLTAVPFENLSVFHRRGVSTDPARSWAKIVEGGRGGWCYELNGAFAALLEALGFPVVRLGASVLLDGPPGPCRPDHLALRVQLDRPYLVDVGFGDTFIRPLPLDDPGPHDGGTGSFGFSTDGPVTTLYEATDEGRRACYEFDAEVDHEMSRFEPSSVRLQTEPGLRWTQHPFATRLLDGGPDRVSLLADRLAFRRDGAWAEEPISGDRWAGALRCWFGMDP